MRCAVCEWPDVKKDRCPNCDTDLTSLFQLKELPDFYYNEAVKLIWENRMDEAVGMLIVTTVLSPAHIDSHLLLGKIYAQKSRYEEAVHSWERVLMAGDENTPAKEEAQKGINKVRAILEKNRSLPQVKAQRIKNRWIISSLVFSLVAFIIGISLPIRLSHMGAEKKLNQEEIASTILNREASRSKDERAVLEKKIDSLEQNNKVLISKITTLSDENNILKSKFNSITELKEAIRKLEIEKKMSAREMRRDALFGGNKGYVYRKSVETN